MTELDFLLLGGFTAFTVTAYVFGVRAYYPLMATIFLLVLAAITLSSGFSGTLAADLGIYAFLFLASSVTLL
ncbi:MAG: hypothetical protein ACE5KO_05915, partial [Candidatus Bathyarchaeia archaeon]